MKISNFFLLFLVMLVCVLECRHLHTREGAYQGQRSLITLELELQEVSRWQKSVLRIRHRSSRRTVYALNQ